MRIAFIHPFLYRFARGIERYTLQLSLALSRKGIQVEILTWDAERPVALGDVTDRLTILPIRVGKYGSTLRSVQGLLSQLRRGRYDRAVIHFAEYGEAHALRLLRFFGKAPHHDIVLHFPYSLAPHRYHSLRRHGLFTAAAHVVAVSGFVAEEATPLLDVPPLVISHGVDTTRFTPDTRAFDALKKELKLSGATGFLVTVAAMEERKGTQWMIRALPHLHASHPELHYVVVGDGPYRSKLLRLRSELRLDRQVHFVGARTDTERFYQAADLSVILSRGEASSLAALESMSCATPVVASRHRPFEELIQPEWGLRLDEEDTFLLADTLFALLRDRDRLRKMGAAAREHILQCHTWDEIAAQYLDKVFS